jgi:two-component system, OmpR family, phosphate regulon sensor histidine kinase PhoR
LYRVNRQRQYFIIAVISLSILTLMGLEFYWVREAITQEIKDFDDKTKTVLDRVALRHEKAEEFRKYQTLLQQNFEGKYQDMLRQEFKNLMAIKEQVEIRDTIIRSGNADINYLIITGRTVDTITGIQVEHRVLAKNVKEFHELMSPESSIPTIDSANAIMNWGTREAQDLFRKSRYINELMVQAFREDLFLKSAERIDLDLLDSILQEELHAAGIPLHYTFNVVDTQQVPVKKKTELASYEENLSKFQYTCQLFPADMFHDPLEIRIYFPNRKQFVWNEIWLIAAVALLVVVLMIISFYIMYNTLISQRNLSEMKSDFISNMTHEFKTPISTISLACEAMKDKDMSANLGPDNPFVNMIQEENKRLESLVESILQSAVIEKGELKLHLQPLDMNALIHGVLNKVNMRVQAMGGKLHNELSVGIAPVFGDKIHLTNVVNNLLDNALKYCDKTPDIHVRSFTKDNAVHIEIKDNGIGIRKEHIARIFDKLYRVPTGNVHNVKGFGLGLSYVKSITDLHEGDIKVESQPGIGSTFTLKLKRHEEF